MKNQIELGDKVTYTSFNCEGLVLSFSDANNQGKTSDILLTNGIRVSTTPHNSLILISKAKKGDNNVT